MNETELGTEARRRYARQLSLPEIGERGQALLDAHGFHTDLASQGAEVAADYLRRAGCAERPVDGDLLAAPDRLAARRFAGDADLLEAAAVVLGAYAAVEHIKQVCGVGEPGQMSPSMTLMTLGGPAAERRADDVAER